MPDDAVSHAARNSVPGPYHLRSARSRCTDLVSLADVGLPLASSGNATLNGSFARTRVTPHV